MVIVKYIVNLPKKEQKQQQKSFSTKTKKPIFWKNSQQYLFVFYKRQSLTSIYWESAKSWQNKINIS